MNERDAEQRVTLAGAQAPISGRGGAKRLLRGHGDERVQRPIQSFDARQEMSREFDTRYLSGSEALGKFADGQVMQHVAVRRSPYSMTRGTT